MVPQSQNGVLQAYPRTQSDTVNVESPVGLYREILASEQVVFVEGELVKSF